MFSLKITPHGAKHQNIYRIKNKACMCYCCCPHTLARIQSTQNGNIIHAFTHSQSGGG